MPRKFRERTAPTSSRADWKRERDGGPPTRRGGGIAALMARRGAPAGRPSPGGGLEGMRNHPAVRFGQDMTRGVAEGPMNAIREQVARRLASRGISQDASGTYQIAGLNRPADPGLMIRNAALRGMDPSGEMLRRVLGAGMPSGAMPGRGVPSPGLGGTPISPGLISPSMPSREEIMPPGMPSLRPPDLSRVPTVPGSGNMPMPPSSSGRYPGPPTVPFPPQGQGVGSTTGRAGEDIYPGMYPVHNVPGAGSGGVPSPGLGGVAMRTPPSQFPPQGQGIGRTTTPTGAEVDPTRYPRTNVGPPVNPNLVPGASSASPQVSPGLGMGMDPMQAIKPGTNPPFRQTNAQTNVPISPGLGGVPPSANGGYVGPERQAQMQAEAAANAQMTPVGGMVPGVATPTRTARPTDISPTSDMVPAGLGGTGDLRPGQTVPMDQQLAEVSRQFPQQDIYRQPGATPPQPMSQRELISTLGQTPVPSRSQPQPSSAQPQGFAASGSALMQRMARGQPGTPPAPGRTGMPQMPPGALPGQTTPFRPGQAAPPPRTSFGTPGATPMPARQPADLSNLGNTISQTVASRIAASQSGQRPGVSPARPGTPVASGLEGLGDRIRASIRGATGDTQIAAPGAGGPGLGPATTGIMERVRAQLAQAGVGQMHPPQSPAAPGMTPANGITPAGPSTGAVPSAAQGVAPQPAAPGPAPATAPAPTSGGASANALGVADMIILQESGGAPPTPNNTNCTIRPSAGCLDLNTGIFEVTAAEHGLDWGRLMSGDPEYGRQAVAQLMTGYASDDASQWNGPSGQTVWEYGEQNLPGGGWEAVGRVYFGGDVTGQFVDEQGRSGVTYGQQFVEKLNNAGVNTAPGQALPGTDVGPPAVPGTNVLPSGTTPGTGAPNVDPNLGVIVTDAGVPVTPTGESPATPTSGTPQRLPTASGTMDVTTPFDGMGISAAPATDETWLSAEHGEGAAVSTEYKQEVTWSCTQCGQGCLYNYQCAEAGNGYHGADASTHAGMDIVSPGGYGAPVSSSTGGTVLCAGGAGEGNYVGCNFATSPSVKEYPGDAGQISILVGNDVNGNMLVMEYWHMAGANVEPGQQITPGTQIGTQGGMGGMIHTHQEAHGYCSKIGGMVPLDPTLVNNGYYSTHDPCEGYA